MNDIVERLRPLTQWFSEASEAIEEIERLRGLLREWLNVRVNREDVLIKYPKALQERTKEALGDE